MTIIKLIILFKYKLELVDMSIMDVKVFLIRTLKHSTVNRIDIFQLKLF